jgi:hypothetical protein
LVFQPLPGEELKVVKDSPPVAGKFYRFGGNVIAGNLKMRKSLGYKRGQFSDAAPEIKYAGRLPQAFMPPFQAFDFIPIEILVRLPAYSNAGLTQVLICFGEIVKVYLVVFDHYQMSGHARGIC